LQLFSQVSNTYVKTKFIPTIVRGIRVPNDPDKYLLFGLAAYIYTYSLDSYISVPYASYRTTEVRPIPSSNNVIVCLIPSPWIINFRVFDSSLSLVSSRSHSNSAIVSCETFL
jgi:hypothetical protein